MEKGGKTIEKRVWKKFVSYYYFLMIYNNFSNNIALSRITKRFTN